jgi:hypothetical protein
VSRQRQNTNSPKPLSGHLCHSVDLGHIVAHTHQLDSDSGALFQDIPRAVGILWRRGVRVVPHAWWKMLQARQSGALSMYHLHLTPLWTKMLSGPASQKTPCAMIALTAQSTCESARQPSNAPMRHLWPKPTVSPLKGFHRIAR